jgi:hypothetical protein
MILQKQTAYPRIALQINQWIKVLNPKQIIMEIIMVVTVTILIVIVAIIITTIKEIIVIAVEIAETVVEIAVGIAITIIKIIQRERHIIVTLKSIHIILFQN